VEGFMAKYTINVTIDLRLLAMRLREKGKKFIRVHEIAYELGISPKTAGKIMVSLAKLGYVVKWSEGVYMIVEEKPVRYRVIDR
jgi:Mn-dependent DtxR family transcriptional regulator